MYWVYALKSQVKNYIYVGMTNDLNRRIAEHNAGRGRATKPYLPYKMIYKRQFKTRIETRDHEVYLKSGIGKQLLRNIVHADSDS